MDVELVRRWAAAGFLPTFRRLFEISSWTQYTEPAKYLNGVPWTGINTGLSPLRNDFYSISKFCPGSYSMEAAQADAIKGDPFWKWFAESGRRILIADVPFAIPRPAYGGRQFCGWGQHDIAWKKASVPNHLLPDVSSRFGTHPIRYCHNYTTETDSVLRLRSGLLTGIDRRAAMLKSLITSGGWDLCYGVFAEAHCGGHLMWHLEDESHPRHSREQFAAVGHALRDVYAALDRALGELIECAGAETICAIFFSHGMGPNHNAEHLFSQFVGRFNHRWGGKNLDMSFRNGKPGWFGSLWQNSVGRISPEWRAGVKHRLPMSLRSWITLKRQQNSAHWSRAPAFAIPRDGYSSLRVNLKGREPKGQLLPGKEYCRYLDGFTEGLRQLVNAESGEPIVECIFRADQEIDPIELGSGPDLIVWWSKASPIRAIQSPTLGTISGEFRDIRTGEHVMRGALLISRAHVKRGHHPISGMKGVDIPATLCELGAVQPGIPLEGTSRVREFLADHD